MPERTAAWEKADSHSSGGERVSHSVICQGQPPINTFYFYNTFLCVFKPTELKENSWLGPEVLFYFSSVMV